MTRLAARLRISGLGEEERRVSFAIASSLLRYPDENLLAALGPLCAAADGLPSAARRPISDLGRYLGDHTLLESQAAYVATFDLKRRCSLYLSYYLNGDTRRRGAALWRFQQAYRRAGLRVGNGELPDYLPALLELAATVPGSAAIELMREHLVGIRVLRGALEELDSPYAGVVAAVETLLPGSGSAVTAEAMRLAQAGPPAELVGLEPPGALGPYEPGGCGRIAADASQSLRDKEDA
jgi:nitrate reductase delta subunit